MFRKISHLTTFSILLVLLLAPVASAPRPASAQILNCSNFDTWIWAQAHFDRDKDANAALDPDGNGVACQELSVAGFAPTIWADSVPEGLTPAKVVSVADGDTITVEFSDGTTDTVRLLHIDSSETSGTIGQCGGPEAAWFLDWILGYAKGGTIYLESDVTERDRYDRRLAYIWFQVEGDPNPYMANDAMVLSGWAESETSKPDIKYKEQLDASEQFSIEHVTGTRLLCGKFSQPANDAGPSNEQIRQAWLKQPNQGQLPPFPGSQQAAQPETQPQPQPVSQDAGVTQTVDTAQPSAPPPPVDEAAEVPPAGIPGTAEPSTDIPNEIPTEVVLPPTEEPVYIPPTEAPVVPDPVVVEPPPAQECEASYPTLCIQPAWVIGDLDCPDIGASWFPVYAPDSHGFDGDFDGYGCEG